MLTSKQKRKCAKCGHSSSESVRSFHRIPKLRDGKDHIEKCRQWAKFVYPNENWDSEDSEFRLRALGNKSRVVCSAHFDEKDFTDHARRLLHRLAIPHILEAPATQEPAPFAEHSPAMLDLNPPRAHQNVSAVNGGTFENSEPPDSIPMEVEVSLPTHVQSLNQVSSLSEAAATPKIISTPEKGIPEATPAFEPHTPTPVPSSSNSSQVTSPRVLFPDESRPEASTSAPKPRSVSKAAREEKVSKAILKSLGKTRVSQLTPSKRVLYQGLKKAHREIRRLRKKAETSPREALKDLNSSIRINQICGKAKMSHAALTFFKAQIRQTKNKPKGRRWKMDDKLLALTIYKRSPSGYRFLRKLFALPCPSTLNNLLSSFPLRPGVSNEVLESLKKSVSSMKENDKVCTVSFDEMSIKHSVAYNPKLDLIEGYEDHGEQGRSNKIASYACVFMVCGLRKFWKQPVAYYLSGSAMSSDRLKILLTDVIRKLRSIGLKPVATICDMGSNNVSALRKLRSRIQDCFFTIDGEEIIIIYDPPHLLKCIRNMFMKHDVQCFINAEILDANGEKGKVIEGSAKWEHLVKLYELQKPLTLFRRAKKLTAAHINPKFGQAMKVKLAAQVFSHSAGVAILSYSHKHNMGDTSATGSFLLEMDTLFDSVNGFSKDLQDGKFLKTRITKNSGHLKFWTEMKRKIRKWKFGSRDPPSKSGWLRTLIGMEKLWKKLQVLGFTHLAPRRLNQDPLENLFGVIRQLCGSNAKPNVPQFIGALKTAIINNVASQEARNMNCEADEANYLSNLRALLTKQVAEKDKTDDSKAKTDDSKDKTDDSKAKTDDSKAKTDDSKDKTDDSKAKTDDSKAKTDDSKDKTNDSKDKEGEEVEEEEEEEVEETCDDHFKALCEQAKIDFHARSKKLEEQFENGDEEAVSMAYAAGFIAGRILKEKNMKEEKEKAKKNVVVPQCPCSNLLTSQGACNVFNSFIDLKEYDHTQRLTRPSLDLGLTVSHCAEIVDKYLCDNAYLSNVKASIFAIIDHCVNFSWLENCQIHYKSNIEAIKTSCFSIWLNWWLNRKNRSFGEDKQKVRKKVEKMTHK